MTNYRRRVLITYLLVFTLLLLCLLSCKHARKNPDVSNVKIDLKVLRFEQDLFRADFEKLADSLPFFRKKYGEFFDIFNYKIIRIGSDKDQAFPERLKYFVTDYNMHNVYKDVTKQFGDINELQLKITKAFKYYKYYFQQLQVPVVITCITGFNQSVITTDTILGIGLDRYLGTGCKYYNELGLAHYQQYNMTSAKIPSDCIRGWALTQFPSGDSSTNVLSQMVYQGKVCYFSQMLMPDEPDSLIIGMSASQVEWCKENENKMWTFLVEKKILFKSDYQTINKFIGSAPFTKDFGRNSPGRAAIWLGWQIVCRYMELNDETGLPMLMKENDYQKILRLSKYKP
jgi:gliding motility-associated lipoprotein GldB